MELQIWFINIDATHHPTSNTFVLQNATVDSLVMLGYGSMIPSTLIGITALPSSIQTLQLHNLLCIPQLEKKLGIYQTTLWR